jgi:hypothetical protein
MVAQEHKEASYTAAQSARQGRSHRRHSSAAFHQTQLSKATFGYTPLLDEVGKPLSLPRLFESSSRLHLPNLNCGSLTERSTPASMAYHELGIIGKSESR